MDARLRLVSCWAALIGCFVAGRAVVDRFPEVRRLGAWTGLVALWVAYLVLLALARRFTGHSTLRARKLVARHLGLRWQGRGWVSHDSISGELNGFSVVVRDDDKLRERIEVALRSLPSATVLPMSARGDRPLLGRMETGDPELDAEVLIDGVTPWQVLPCFDASTRALTRQLVANEGFAIGGGRLFREANRPTTDAHLLERLLTDATMLARSLLTTSRVDSAEGLARLAREDEVQHERRRCLQILVASCPDLPLTAATCREALADDSPWVRLQAAKGLGQEGIEPLQDLLDPTSCPDSVVVEALRHFAAIAPAAAIPSLKTALAQPNEAARRFAAETLGKMRHVAAVGQLGTLLETADEQTAVVAAQALEVIGSSDAEPALIHALGRTELAVLQAATRALERVGTVEAVPALQSIAEADMTGAHLRHAARDAARAIQARLSGAEAGLLAVAAPDSGEGLLALAPERQGELSLSRRQEREGQKQRA